RAVECSGRRAQRIAVGVRVVEQQIAPDPPTDAYGPGKRVVRGAGAAVERDVEMRRVAVAVTIGGPIGEAVVEVAAGRARQVRNCVRIAPVRIERQFAMGALEDSCGYAEGVAIRVRVVKEHVAGSR